MKKLAIFAASGFFLLSSVLTVSAATLAHQVAGKIVLDVEQHGEAWYIYPKTEERYYLKDGAAAYEALRAFGLGITNVDLAKVPDEDDMNEGDWETRKRLAGYILLQVEEHGEAWYVSPSDYRRYYMKDGDEAYSIMRYLSLGITSANLAQIPIASSSPRPPMTTDSSYEAYTFTTNEGSFPVRVITMRRDAFKMVTDVATPQDCEDDCAAQPLAEYMEQNGAFAGIHGSYACPPDYAECAGKTYSFTAPAFDSNSGVMINDDLLVFFDRPMIVQTTDGQLEYFHRGTDFGSTLADYEASTGKEVSAAIGNWPSLVEAGQNIVAGEPMEEAFLKKAVRGGIGWNDDYFFLVIASNATVPNLASIFEKIGVQYAMNLDGGGTAAMYYDDAYVYGPGRLLANAILFKER